jgi:hypothetical protein
MTYSCHLDRRKDIADEFMWMSGLCGLSTIQDTQVLVNVSSKHLISVRQKLNKSVEASVRNFLDGCGTSADGLDGGSHAGLVVARDVRLELAKNDPGIKHAKLGSCNSIVTVMFVR